MENTAGAILACHKRLGDSVVILHLTLGEGGNPRLAPAAYAEQKKREALAAAAALGAEVIFGPYQDGQLPVSDEAVRYVADVIREVKPTHVITHWRKSLQLSYSNLWLARREGSAPDKVKTSQLTTGTQSDDTVSVSPDGRQIAFARFKDNGANIFVMPTEGGPTRQVTFRASFNKWPVWSPDGREIAFVSTEGGTAKVWSVDAAGGTPKVFGRSLAAKEAELAWAPGRQILYQAPGNQNFRLLDPASGSEVPLLTKEQEESGWAFAPRYSPGAGSVAIYWNRARPHVAGLWLVGLKGGSEARVGEGNLWPLAWSSTGRGIYAFAFSEIENSTVVLVPSSGGKPETFMKLPFVIQERSGMTPDGRLVAVVSQKQSDVWLMENFDPEVEP
jgi:Tol biopolymer transport system component